jgi:hypothetical protein
MDRIELNKPTWEQLRVKAVENPGRNIFANLEDGVTVVAMYTSLQEFVYWKLANKKVLTVTPYEVSKYFKESEA